MEVSGDVEDHQEASEGDSPDEQRMELTPPSDSEKPSSPRGGRG